MRTPISRRGKGDQGLAVIMTGLLLIPLMTFAAFGVDLASWYSRISQIQKAADAAALAGTVWMPNLTRATTEAEASLRANGFQDGVDGIVVDIERGATPTSLRVEVTDTGADRVFSQVFRGQQTLTRHAEAEYNLPIPLGSPLNYFGGDAERTVQPATFSYDPVWPTPWPPGSSWRPVNFGCNVGLNGANTNAGLGRYDGSGNFVANDHSGSTVCLWEVQTTTNTTTTNVPPASHFLSAPRSNAPNQQCRVQPGNNSTYRGRFLSNGTWDVATNVGGSWNFNNGTGSNNWPRCAWGGNTTPPEPDLPTNRPCNINPGTFRGRYTSSSSTAWSRTSSGSTTCSWTATSTIVPTSPLPPNFDTVSPAGSPRPCNVTGAPEHGSWASSGGHSFTVNSAWPKCRWPARFTVTETTLPNPIDSTRSPGFWAAVEGPQTRAYQGDAYNTRCYTSISCTSDQNEMYVPVGDADRGRWYVVKIPAGLTGSVALNVFDAAYVSGSLTAGSGDRTIDGGGNFPTSFRVYQQTNPLDFTARSGVGNNSVSNTDGSCNWQIGQDNNFKNQWRNLCNLTVSPGQTYLINVQSTGTTGAGVNGYALEAVAGGNHANTPQPALYAYAAMTMQNNNFCDTTGCVPPPATFYLAEVGPQYAGRTLVMELWDSGDVSGTAAMYPMMPATTSTNPANATLPRPVIPVPAGDCSFTADANPNSRISGVTGTEYTTPQGSDYPGECGINTSTGSGARFNGEWLRIRIDIPADYTCTPGINPETNGNSCWWGIRYVFGASANDVTTWQARIEGNPLQLTQ